MVTINAIFYRKIGTDEMHGPFTVPELKKEINKHDKIKGYDIEIWDGNVIQDWKPIQEIPPLMDYFFKKRRCR